MNEIIIGNKIADGRKAKKLSQSQFAEMLNVSPQAVSKWERGESLPDILMLGEIAKVIGVDLNHFADIKTTTNVKSSKARNMSHAQWKNADFSGLDNLNSKLSCANIEHCKFTNATLGGILFKANNMGKNDFSNAKMRDCQFVMANVENNNFQNADLSRLSASRSNIDNNNFVGANFTDAVFKYCKFDQNDLTNAIFQGVQFDKSEIKKVVFPGNMTDCSFVFCNFKKVEFVNVVFKNLFIKGKIKGATFTNCKADKLSYEFLKSANADVSGIALI